MWMSKEQKARLTAYRAAMDAAVESVRENTAALNKVAVMARPWAPGAYAVGDVRVDGGIPYRCVQAHDSSANPAWTPGATPARVSCQTCAGCPPEADGVMPLK